MDKQFWRTIRENKFAFPEEHSILSLTEELFSLIASTDSELRDTIGLEAFYNWLMQGLYSESDLRSFITRLIANLQNGIGEIGSDSVFLRSFSALWLTNIIFYDNENSVLEKEDILPVVDAALAYFAGERDIRGYVPVKGYAHAIAHAADLFWALAISKHTVTADHLKMLDSIALKLRDVTLGIYQYNEDSRIARALMHIFIRDTLSLKQIEIWLEVLGSNWNGAWHDAGRTQAFNNMRNLMRSLYWNILTWKNPEIPHKNELLKLLQSTLEKAKPWA